MASRRIEIFIALKLFVPKAMMNYVTCINLFLYSEIFVRGFLIFIFFMIVPQLYLF